MAFTGDEDHSISIEDAAQLTQNYREQANSGDVLGEFFGKQALLSILSQEGCVGIRCYFGKRANGQLALVLTGVDENEDDLLEEGEIAETGTSCPPNCSNSNDLNSQT
jgi:hypothetical protein